MWHVKFYAGVLYSGSISYGLVTCMVISPWLYPCQMVMWFFCGLFRYTKLALVFMFCDPFVGGYTLCGVLC